MPINRTTQNWPRETYHELPEPTVTLPARMLSNSNDLMETIADILNCGLQGMAVEVKRTKR